MSNDLGVVLRERASDTCELCGGNTGLSSFAVAPFVGDDPAHHVLVCDACLARMDSPGLDGNDWHGLRDAIWSEHTPVQVLAWRLLHRLEDAWAKDLLEQVYLDDETREWAEAGVAPTTATEDRVRTLDSNGAQLMDGDSVTLIKDLDVKGTSFVAKRGTLVRGIRLTDNPEHIEGKVNGVVLVLKTMFLKKA